MSIYYPYDTPSMLFITLGLILIYKRQWVPYYLLFAVATFNRETTCFLTAAYVFTAIGKDRARRIALHSAAQVLIWAGIKYYLNSLYGDNPGEGVYEDKFTSNLRVLSDPSNVLFFLSSMGFVLIPTLALCRRIRDDFVKRSLLVLIPYFGGMLFVGNMLELRIYGDMVPIVLTAFILVVRDLMAAARPPIPEKPPSGRP